MYSFAKIFLANFLFTETFIENFTVDPISVKCHNVSVILLSVMLRFCVLYHLQVSLIAENFNVFLHQASEFSATII